MPSQPAAVQTHGVCVDGRCALILVGWRSTRQQHRGDARFSAEHRAVQRGIARAVGLDDDSTRRRRKPVLR